MKEKKEADPEKEEFSKYKEELGRIHQRSQELFEQQLSYISAGCLVLSIGFVKDIVKNIECASFRLLLFFGWVLMVITLLLNLLSHLLAAKFYQKTIQDIHQSNFDPDKVVKRFNRITCINWVCVGSLITGILAVIIFINQNL